MKGKTQTTRTIQLDTVSDSSHNQQSINKKPHRGTINLPKIHRKLPKSVVGLPPVPLSKNASNQMQTKNKTVRKIKVQNYDDRYYTEGNQLSFDQALQQKREEGQGELLSLRQEPTEKVEFGRQIDISLKSDINIFGHFKTKLKKHLESDFLQAKYLSIPLPSPTMQNQFLMPASPPPKKNNSPQKALKRGLRLGELQSNRFKTESTSVKKQSKEQSSINQFSSTKSGHLFQQSSPFRIALQQNKVGDRKKIFECVDGFTTFGAN